MVEVAPTKKREILSHVVDTAIHQHRGELPINTKKTREKKLGRIKQRLRRGVLRRFSNMKTEGWEGRKKIFKKNVTGDSSFVDAREEGNLFRVGYTKT